MGVTWVGTTVLVITVAFTIWSCWYDMQKDDVPLDEVLAKFRAEEAEKKARKTK